MKITLLFVLTIAAAFCAAAKAADFPCPSPAEQTGSNLNVDVTGEAQTILKIGNADLKGRVEKTVVDLYSKYPHADKIIILRDLLSTTCNLIKSSSQLTDEQKIDKWYAVFPLIQHLMQSSESSHDQDLTLSNNFSVSFSFPHPKGITGDQVEIALRFVNNEENPINVENISVVELFGYEKEAKYRLRQLDSCYDPEVVTFKTQLDDISVSDSPVQGSRATKVQHLVSYQKSTKIMLNGAELRLPLAVPPKMPMIVTATFEVYPAYKNMNDLNYFAVCPAIKFFNTRGQESVSICPGLLDVFLSREEDLTDSGLIPLRDHIETIGPTPQSGNNIRILAKRAGRFQLTPKMGDNNSCPLVATD